MIPFGGGGGTSPVPRGTGIPGAPSAGLQGLNTTNITGMRMGKGGVVTSKSRKKGGSSKTLRRTTAYNMTKAGSYSAGDYVMYHNTAGGETRSAMAPYATLSGTGLKAGGVVKGPVNALLGEKGPEVVVPLKKKFMNMKVKDVARHFARRGAKDG